MPKEVAQTPTTATFAMPGTHLGMTARFVADPVVLVESTGARGAVSSVTADPVQLDTGTGWPAGCRASVLPEPDTAGRSRPATSRSSMPHYEHIQTKGYRPERCGARADVQAFIA